jgi:hypothetical protein
MVCSSAMLATFTEIGNVTGVIFVTVHGSKQILPCSAAFIL